MTRKARYSAITGLVTGLLSAALPGVARAHGGRDLDAGAVWAAWNPTLAVSGPLVLLGVIYLRGAIRRSRARTRVSTARHIAFATGLAAVFLSLQSPIDLGFPEA